MKNDNRANQWPLNVTAFVIFLPVLLYPQFIQIVALGHIRHIRHIQSLIKGGHWLSLLVVVLIIALYVASFILVLWKGRLRLAVLTVFLSFLLHGVSFWILPKAGEAGPRQLVIHEYTLRIDVYCNDVYLGETPLKISETEFHEKVKPWDTPPRQKMVIGEEFIQNIKTHRYGLANTELRWFYIPYNYFDRHRVFHEPGFSSYHDAVKSGYWWRFEKDGCAGLAASGGMVWGSYEDGQPLSRPQSWVPDLQYSVCPAVSEASATRLEAVELSTLRRMADARCQIFRSTFPTFI